MVTKACWNGVPKNGSLWLTSWGGDAADRSFVENSLDHDPSANHTLTRWKPWFRPFSSHQIYDAWLRGQSYGWRETAPEHSLQVGPPSKQRTSFCFSRGRRISTVPSLLLKVEMHDVSAGVVAPERSQNFYQKKTKKKSQLKGYNVISFSFFLIFFIFYYAS